MAEKKIAENRKAYHEYFIEDRFEAGIVLVGTEIKSARKGKVQLKDSYIKKHLVFSKNGQAISVSVLKKQQNDLNFTIEEIKEILEMINSLDSTKEKYEQFKKIVKKKKKNG